MGGVVVMLPVGLADMPSITNPNSNSDHSSAMSAIAFRLHLASVSKDTANTD